jgi:Carbohydrate esterase, sialic acid-specific acetylesterase
MIKIAAVALASVLSLHANASGDKPMKVFILAGQSNMQGHAVVDLKGKDYNEGKGTLAAFLADPATRATYAHLVNADGSWRVRDDVWVRYQPGDDSSKKPARTGGLGFGFTPYQDQHHFGPELQFGQILGDALEEDVLLVKTAWGGKSLFVDFRPPSAGGETGKFYNLMIEQVRTALANAATEFPQAKSRGVELAGFVWYQGWNDGCDPKNAVPAYEENLVHLIHDVRRDLGAPNLPVVVGELTGPWVDAPGEWDALRKAQSAAATRDEFKGSVVFVPTAAFVRDKDDSPNPGHGHHEFGNAETIFLVGDALGRAMRSLVVPGSPAFVPTLPPAKPSSGELSGYMLVPVDKAPPEFNAGFSLYAAAWPLVERYPGHDFQSGLFGTWMFAQQESTGKREFYSDIEGGLGWWRDTHFPTETPKFIMGGVAVEFEEIANGPGYGRGSWEEPRGCYGVAQISPWVVFPLDGLNLKQGTCGELFGYGYLPLPLVPATKASGDQCWTLFLNTATFKGPLAFFTPAFWSRSGIRHPEFAGKLLDTRPSEPNKAFQMETQWVDAAVHTPADGAGTSYARVQPMSFPLDKDGRTVVLHRLSVYRPAALTEGVRAWFAGGSASSGAIDAAHAHVQTFGKGGGSTWRVFAENTAKENRFDVDWRSFGKPIAHDEHTFGYEWDAARVAKVDDGRGARVRMPEYFRLDPREGKKPHWTIVGASDVPASTGLAALRFETPRERPQPARETAKGKDSPFAKPGPAAGPFDVKLGDGSTLTYAWYRFADQPAMLQADLTDAEREEAQRRIELLHRTWTKERDYLPPPTTGSLAELDPALLVTPPKGLEVGYVPIALRQAKRGK